MDSHTKVMYIRWASEFAWQARHLDLSDRVRYALLCRINYGWNEPERIRAYFAFCPPGTVFPPDFDTWIDLARKNINVPMHIPGIGRKYALAIQAAAREYRTWREKCEFVGEPAERVLGKFARLTSNQKTHVENYIEFLLEKKDRDG